MDYQVLREASARLYRFCLKHRPPRSEGAPPIEPSPGMNADTLRAIHTRLFASERK